MKNSLFKKIFCAFLSVCISISLLSGCELLESINFEDKNDSKNSEISDDNTQEQEIKYNSLTGLEIASEYENARPVAFMVNNIKIAQPLLGVSKADIIYECLVEGGITRLLAVYKNVSDVECIGSIRSVRPCYLSLIRGLDAIILYNGTSVQAKNIINSDDLSAYDIGYYNNACWRDDDRRKNLGYEHSLLTSGEMANNLINKCGERLTSDYSIGLEFGASSQVKNGDNANKMTVKFSSYKNTVFEYNSSSKEYDIFQFNDKQYDDYYNVQNTAKNVIAIFVNCSVIDDEGHINLELISSGNGYYMSEGKYIKIKWSKESEDSPLLFTDENGNQLVMTPGKQYVCCVPQYGSVEIS